MFTEKEIELEKCEAKLQSSKRRENIALRMISCDRKRLEFFEKTCQYIESMKAKDEEVIAEIEEIIRKDYENKEETTESTNNGKTKELYGEKASEEEFILDAIEYDFDNESLNETRLENASEDYLTDNNTDTATDNTTDDADILIEKLFGESGDEENTKDKIEVKTEPTVTPKHVDRYKTKKKKRSSADKPETNPEGNVNKSRKAENTYNDKTKESDGEIARIEILGVNRASKNSEIVDFGSEQIDIYLSSFHSPKQQQQFMSDAANNISTSMNSDKLGTPIKIRKKRRKKNEVDPTMDPDLERQCSNLMSSICDAASGKSLWQCIQCNYSSKLRYTVKEHVETHISGFSHQCCVCKKTCKTRNSLRVHTIRNHSSAGQMVR